MSQKSVSRSPKSPASKSPSCGNNEGAEGQDNQSHRIVAGDLQEAVQELGNSSRVPSEVRHSMSRSGGASIRHASAANDQSRGSHYSITYRPPTAPLSRIPSPRSAFACEEPSPLPSSITYGERTASSANRVASMGGSQRSSRLPSPEHTDQQVYSNLNEGGVEFDSRTEEDVLNDVLGMNGELADMNPSSREFIEMNTSPSRGRTSSSGSRGTRRGERRVNSSSPSNKTSKNPSSAGMAAANSAGLAAARSVGLAGTNSAGVAASSAGLARPLSGTSGFLINKRVDAGVSAMSYRMPGQQLSSNMGGSCMPGSRRFLSDIEEVSPEPTQSAYTAGAVAGSGSTGRDFGRGCRSRGGIQNQAPPRRGTASAESEHHAYNLAGAPSYNHAFDHALPPPSRDPFARTAGSGTAGLAQHHYHGGPEELPERDERMVSALGHLSQLKKTSSYLLCGLNQGADFLKLCLPKVTESSIINKPANLPEIPCLRQEKIADLIKCEAQDVESVSYLTSDERKSYKKPCPKQQKAQMTVKSLMQAHTRQSTCQKEYSPLEHPDPEDISPEVAAAMMFSQERGIKMDECPNDIITDLFPEEKKAPFPEKIPQSNISIVDRNSKDQEEMMEKSATVPSDGVSDSAYTRTMKEKGEDVGPQRSFDVDFAIGQSKREYVLVAQKPQRINKVQYRGNSPSWFPGYLSAFPDDVNLKVVSSPSGLFHRAWAHSNPENIPAGDVIVLD